MGVPNENNAAALWMENDCRDTADKIEVERRWEPVERGIASRGAAQPHPHGCSELVFDFKTVVRIAFNLA